MVVVQAQAGSHSPFWRIQAKWAVLEVIPQADSRPPGTPVAGAQQHHQRLRIGEDERERECGKLGGGFGIALTLVRRSGRPGC